MNASGSLARMAVRAAVSKRVREARRRAGGVVGRGVSALSLRRRSLARERRAEEAR